MGMLSLKYSRLRLTKVERGGFFMLVVLFVMLLLLERYLSDSRPGLVELNSEEVNAWLLAYDSVALAQSKSRTKIFPFNPNFISPAKADRLGLSAQEFKRFQDFRDQGNWINSAEDFQRVTGISDLKSQRLTDLFKFPEFLKSKPHARNARPKKISFSQASNEQLMLIKGIGPAIAQRIIRACKKWGGIGNEPELMMIYGITPTIKEDLLGSFFFDQKFIEPRNINILNASDLTEVPGINFPLAKTIWEFVRLRQGLSELEELLLLDEIQPRLFEVIQLYLYAMKNEPDGLPRS